MITSNLHHILPRIPSIPIIPMVLKEKSVTHDTIVRGFFDVLARCHWVTVLSAQSLLWIQFSFVPITATSLILWMYSLIREMCIPPRDRFPRSSTSLHRSPRILVILHRPIHFGCIAHLWWYSRGIMTSSPTKKDDFPTGCGDTTRMSRSR